jgi:hypothetical protein
MKTISMPFLNSPPVTIKKKKTWDKFLHLHQLLRASELGCEVVIFKEFLVRRLEQAVAARKS